MNTFTLPQSCVLRPPSPINQGAGSRGVPFATANAMTMAMRRYSPAVYFDADSANEFHGIIKAYDGMPTDDGTFFQNGPIYAVQYGLLDNNGVRRKLRSYEDVAHNDDGTAIRRVLAGERKPVYLYFRDYWYSWGQPTFNGIPTGVLDMSLYQVTTALSHAVIVYGYEKMTGIRPGTVKNETYVWIQNEYGPTWAVNSRCCLPLDIFVPLVGWAMKFTV